MTCVDAAIIKALVEHIGGNPDDIPAGGNQTLLPSSNKVIAPPTNSIYEHAFFLYNSPKILDIIKLRRLDNGEIDTFIYLDVEEKDLNTHVHRFYQVNAQDRRYIQFTNDGLSYHIFSDTDLDSIYEIPQQTEDDKYVTGYYSCGVMTNDIITTYIRFTILKAVSENDFQIYNNIMIGNPRS